jgi:hypothetical protein
MEQGGELWRFAKLRQVKFLNNSVEQDHRRIGRLVRSGLGLQTRRGSLCGDGIGFTQSAR